MVGLNDIFGFISALAWPLVVIIALIAFHGPLSGFLKMVAQRATRLSVTQFFAFELQLPEALHPKLDQYLPELQAFASGLEDVSQSSSTLYRLWGERGDKAVDYMIVDLESGEKWLTSRLFIFAVMLERMRGLQCLVFLGTHADTNVPRSFLGTASPHDVRWSLAQRYPWLEEAYVQAQIRSLPMLLKQGTLEPSVASRLVLAFLEEVQEIRPYSHPPEPEKKNEWEFRNLEDRRSYWEHANWIDRVRLEHDLRDVLLKSDGAFEDSLDISQVRRVQALLRRKGSFVALTNKEGQFNSLVDRKILLEQVAERIGKLSDDQTLGE